MKNSQMTFFIEYNDAWIIDQKFVILLKQIVIVKNI